MIWNGDREILENVKIEQGIRDIIGTYLMYLILIPIKYLEKV
jgi:hypothetical protein